jgi:hydroxyethylthiazole kinase-like uncharacterized protein yjeF
MSEWQLWTAADARRAIAVPQSSDDKYSRGVLGVIAGSIRYPGAGVLVCNAAMRTGLGLLRYLGPRSVEDRVLSRNPEIVLGEGQVDAWLIGSGIIPKEIGGKRHRQISRACKSNKPICLDAGALNFIDEVTGPTIITPHYRELAALFANRKIVTSLSNISSNPKHWAMLAAQEFGVTVLLKGNVSVVASNEHQIELPSATPWLATAGTGDVLSGIIGALMATNSNLITEKKIDLASIAATGSFIHACAAAIANRGGPIIASDVAQNIPIAISEINKSVL